MISQEVRLLVTALCLCLAQSLALGLVDSPTNTSLAESSGCPQWFLDYQQFHKSSRGQPGAKYIVHVVSGRPSGGLGDRLRGLVFTLRLASALQRVLLATWDKPADITEFLSPPGDINWSTVGINTSDAVHTLDLMHQYYPKEQVLQLVNASNTTVRMKSNAFMDSECAGCPTLDAWSSEAVCIFQSLFRPKDVVLRAAEEQLQHLYGVSDQDLRYTAIHLRLGHLHGEQVDFDTTGGAVGPFRAFLAGMVCARQLAAMHDLNTTRTPILLVTDHHHLRRFVQQGHFPTVVTPNGGGAVHLDNAVDASIAAHQQTFIELIMLGKSECMVTSNSGFSHMAWLLGGGKKCKEQVKSCL